MWINENIVREALHSLREMEPTPKRGKERTSCLMYFMAFDSMVAKGRGEPILLDPEIGAGLDNRREFTEAYCHLVSVGCGQDGKEHWVDNLGEVNFSGKRRSDKKFSGDFLTVPLKKASAAALPQDHPRRPSPLLSLGVEMYGSKWGVQRHPDWKSHLPDFLNDRFSPTKWTSLAIFVLRDEPFGPHGTLLKEKFTAELAELWVSRINAEKRRLKVRSDFTTQTKNNPFPRPSGQASMVAESWGPSQETWEQILDELAQLRAENTELRKQIDQKPTKRPFRRGK